MMASPPESSRARLLKLRRVHLEFTSENRERALGLLVAGKGESAVGWLSLYAVGAAGCVPAKDSDVISIAMQFAPETLGLVA